MSAVLHPSTLPQPPPPAQPQPQQLPLSQPTAAGAAVVTAAPPARSARGGVLALVLLALALVLWLLGTGVGSTGLENLWPALWGQGVDPAAHAMAQQIVWDIRLPRTLGAWAAGALLGLAGAVAQGLFRNPLADPYLLGSASGASLGVALALALFGGGSAGLLGFLGVAKGSVAVSVFSSHWLVRLGLTGAAFVGAVLAVLLTLVLARGVQHTLRLLLAGVIVGVVLGAITSLLLLLSPDSLQAMQAFMLGSTGFVGWSACLLMASVWLVCLVLAWVLSRALDGLALGEATAHSLGLPLAPLRAALVAVLALATGTAVAQTGLIAFVGLAAPHLVRAAVSVPHGRLMLLSSLMGGALLCAADLLARGLMAPQELPVGVLTAVLGGGYLLWLMHRRSSPGGLL
ncbi:MAG: iron ABC transporter permease [Giesbergeria sp.]|nr:iron ABC transporter permease [Giesbergeria sp.]